MPPLALIDYNKYLEIENNARQYWHSLRTDDPDFKAALSCYQQAKANRVQWYTENKAELDKVLKQG